MNKFAKAVLLLLAGASPVVLCAVTIASHFFAYESGLSSETILIETGLTVVTMAISVWIGLNVYNLITKDEIDSIVKASIDHTISTGMAKQGFLNELEKSSSIDPLCQYLHEQFIYSSPADFPYRKLWTIEKTYAVCQVSYNAGNWSLANHHAKTGSLLIASILESHPSFKKLCRSSQLFRLYYNSRQGDFLFYKCCSSRHLPDTTYTPTNFLDNVDKLCSCYKNILTNLKKGLVKSQNDTLKAYISNTIGYPCYLAYKEACKAKDVTPERKSRYLKDALQYAFLATIYTNTGMPHSQYFRNFGVILEALTFDNTNILSSIDKDDLLDSINKKIETFGDSKKLADRVSKKSTKQRKFAKRIKKKIEKLIGTFRVSKKTRDEVSNNSEATKTFQDIVEIFLDSTKLEKKIDIIKEYYKKSIKQDVTDYKSYNTYAALTLSYYDNVYKIRERTSLLCDMSFNNTPLSKNVSPIDLCNECIEYLEIAKNICPTDAQSYYNLGKAYLYKYLFNGKSLQEYWDKGLNYLKQAKILNSETSSYKYILRNLYEAKGDLENAKKINDSLKGNGDSGNIGTMYESLIHSTP